MKDPKTRQEWHTAVDCAEGALALDAARQYGLVTGGPAVNVDRCLEILERGAELGVRPSPHAIESFMQATIADEARKRGPT